MGQKKIKFIDLFAGIGGFHKALEMATENSDYDIKCVLVSEIDKESIETYSHNFSINKKKIINIRNVNELAQNVPNHDFLFAGFPCQTFSNAGKKKGFLDEIRGTLFFDIVKILKYKRPKYILLENVKHLVNHDNGKTWKKIIETLRDDLGYIIPKDPLILSPIDFFIPQDRKRVFIPGVLKEKTNNKENYISIDFDGLKLKNKSKYIQCDSDLEYIRKNFLEEKIDSKYFLNNKKHKYLLEVFKAWEVFIKKIKRPVGRTIPVIWANEFKKDFKLDINMPDWKKKYIIDMKKIYELNKDFIDKWLIKYNVMNWNKREQKLEWQAGKDCNNIKQSFIQLRQSGIRCKKAKSFPTLVAMVQIPIIYDILHKKWRYLTPRETAKLQSFPDNYKIYNEISNNKNKDFYCYKQFGNSVNISIVSYIQEHLLNNY